MVRELHDAPYYAAGSGPGTDDADGENNSLRTLDLYFPDSSIASEPGTTSAILIVFVHGGAWRSGDKSEHAKLARSWVSELNSHTSISFKAYEKLTSFWRRYTSTGSGSQSSPDTTTDRALPVVVAVPNYRLSSSPRVKHPSHAQDVESALEFLLNPSQSPSLDNGHAFTYNRVWLVGHSAGAHIIASLVLDPPPRQHLHSAGINAGSTSDAVLTPSSSTSTTHQSLSPSLSSTKKSNSALLKRLTGIMVLDGIYDLDLLLKDFPSDYYRGFVEQAFGPPGTPNDDGYAYASFNASRYLLPANGSADDIRWAVVHSPEDVLVNVAQAKTFLVNLRNIYSPPATKGASASVVEDLESIKGGHDEMLMTSELLQFVRRLLN